MPEQDPARRPQEPGGGPSDPVAGPGPAPVLRTDLRQNSLGLLVLLYYRSQGREQWIHNAGAALGESEEEYEKVVGGPT